MLIADFDTLDLNDGSYELPYKCGCEFVNNEGPAHVYNCGSRDIDENSFTKAELMSIYLSRLVTKHQISRAAYREFVRFVNTVIRDCGEISLGSKIICKNKKHSLLTRTNVAINLHCTK